MSEKKKDIDAVEKHEDAINVLMKPVVTKEDLEKEKCK